MEMLKYLAVSLYLAVFPQISVVGTDSGHCWVESHQTGKELFAVDCQMFNLELTRPENYTCQHDPKPWRECDALLPEDMKQLRNILYPQYESEYVTPRILTAREWKYIRRAARAHLRGNLARAAHPDVRQHWQNIAAGRPPFGFGYAVQP